MLLKQLELQETSVYYTEKLHGTSVYYTQVYRVVHGTTPTIHGKNVNNISGATVPYSI